MNIRTVLRWFKKNQAIIRDHNYPLYRLIRRGGSGFVHYLHRKLADDQRNNPTKDMKNATKYFNENRLRIETVKTWLEDDESRLIYQTMIDFRCTQDYRILNKIKEIREDKQYFDNEFFVYANGEKLIDGGAYDGDTIDMFNHQMKKRKIKKTSVVAFEPDENNFTRLIKRKVKVIKAGLWSSSKDLRFVEGKESFSRLLYDDEFPKSGEKVSIVCVKCIDDVRECDDATFIKMDIEGAEQEALKGAEKLITNIKPKLAICIYHSDQDMIEIPEWIHKTVPEYRLWIRQHADTIGETVIYAMV